MSENQKALIDAMLVDTSVIGVLAFDSKGSLVRINDMGKRILLAHEKQKMVLTLADFCDLFSVDPPQGDRAFIDCEATVGRNVYHLVIQPAQADDEPITVVRLADFTPIKKQLTMVHAQVSDTMWKVRSRITPVQNALSLLVDYENQDIQPDNLKLLRDARYEIWQLSRHIDNLRDLSLVNGQALRGNLEIEDHAIQEIIEDVLVEIHAIVDYFGKKCTFSKSVDNGLRIRADRHRAAKTLASILINALHYSRQEVEIALSAALTDGMVVVQVEDNGIGIPSGEQQKVFSYGFRAGNAQAIHAGGMGVELYLAREIMTAMHGRISFLSSESKGTRFELSFPEAGMHE